MRRLSVAGLLVLAAAAATAFAATPRTPLVLEGLPKGALNARELVETTVTVHTPRRQARLLLDGREIARSDSGVLTAPLGRLPDGRHVLVAEVDRGRLPGTTRASRVVRVDTFGPVLSLRRDGDVFRGHARDVQHLATAEGRDVEVAQDGSFTVPYGLSASLVAVDDAGNRSVVALPVD
jgi:hypothetical protein